MGALGVPADLMARNAAMKALAELGRAEEALALLDATIEDGLAPDEVSFSTVIHACGRAGQWERALSLLHAMHEGGTAGLLPSGGSDVAVAAAVEACTRAGSVGEALALCEEMVGEGAGSPVIQGMMVTLAWYVALRCVDSCIHVCPSILGGGLTLLTY